MPSCCAASAVTGPIDATTVVRSRSAACSSPKIFAKFWTVLALVNVIGVDLAVEQHPVDVLIAVALAAAEHRPVGRDLGDVGARVAQLVREHFARDVGARQQEARALQSSRRPSARR